MKPIHFRDANQNCTREDCLDLPVLNDGGQLLSCWRMSVRERVSALVFGTAWLCMEAERHPPVWIRATKDVFRDTNLANVGTPPPVSRRLYLPVRGSGGQDARPRGGKLDADEDRVD